VNFGLLRNQPETKEGKFLVLRRDGTVPAWPYFVLGGKDESSHAALMGYAQYEIRQGRYQSGIEVMELAGQFLSYSLVHREEPDVKRVDDPAVIAIFRGGNLRHRLCRQCAKHGASRLATIIREQRVDNHRSARCYPNLPVCESCAITILANRGHDEDGNGYSASIKIGIWIGDQMLELRESRDSGETICGHCGADYHSHPRAEGASFLRVLCDGTLAKI
jgi:hypothetical protein